MLRSCAVAKARDAAMARTVDWKRIFDVFETLLRDGLG
jgi:hypothetical protein